MFQACQRSFIEQAPSKKQVRVSNLSLKSQVSLDERTEKSFANQDLFFCVRFHGKKRFQFCFYLMGINDLNLLLFMWLYSMNCSP